MKNRKKVCLSIVTLFSLFVGLNIVSANASELSSTVKNINIVAGNGVTYKCDYTFSVSAPHSDEVEYFIPSHIINVKDKKISNFESPIKSMSGSFSIANFEHIGTSYNGRTGLYFKITPKKAGETAYIYNFKDYTLWVDKTVCIKYKVKDNYYENYWGPNAYTPESGQKLYYKCGNSKEVCREYEAGKRVSSTCSMSSFKGEDFLSAYTDSNCEHIWTKLFTDRIDGATDNSDTIENGYLICGNTCKYKKVDDPGDGCEDIIFSDLSDCNDYLSENYAWMICDDKCAYNNIHDSNNNCKKDLYYTEAQCNDVVNGNHTSSIVVGKDPDATDGSYNPVLSNPIQASVDFTPTNYTSDGVCSDLKISLDSKIMGGNPVLSGHNYNDYKAIANCIDDSKSQYVAMCIDPGLNGPTSATGPLKYNISDYIQIDSPLGKMLFYLYKNYYVGKGENDINVRNKTDQVARLIIAKNKDSIGLDFIHGGPYESDLSPYYNYNLENGSEISTIYKDVISNYNTINSTNVDDGKVTITNVTKDKVDFKIEGVVSNTPPKISLIVINDDNKREVATTSSCSDTSCTYTLSDQTVCNYTVKVVVDYDNPNDIKNIGIATINGTNTQKQRFLIFNVNGNIRITASKPFDNGGDTDYCDNKNYCDVSVDLSCTEDESNVKLVEGMETGTTSVNWNKCIIEKNEKQATDMNGVSYTIPMSDNPYCSYVCKEDYAFNFPGKLGEFDQGRYISINVESKFHTVVGVAAQRTCISSSINDKKIDVVGFKKDAEDAKKRAVDALNAYNYYVALKEAVTENYPISSDPQKTTCPDLGSGTNNGIWYRALTSGSKTYVKYSFSDSSNVLTSELTSSNASASIGTAFSLAYPSATGSSARPISVTTYSETGKVAEDSRSHTHTSSTCGGARQPACPTDKALKSGETYQRDGSPYNNTLAAIDAEISKAQEAYRDAVNKLNDYSKYINECTILDKDTVADYTYDPEIAFDYAEKDYLNQMNNGGRLTAINPKDVVETTKYCTNSTEVKNGSLASCIDKGSATQTDIKILGSTVSGPTSYSTIPYYHYEELVKIDQFGNPGVSFSGTSTNPEYIYYRSDTAFYINNKSNKGLVQKDKASDPDFILVDIADPALYKDSITTVDGSEKKANGFVFPIKLTTEPSEYSYSLYINNLGQYYGNISSQYGRVFGENGFVTQKIQDSYVCKYTVCPFGGCGGPSACAEIKRDYCGGNVTDASSTECFAKLLENNCCDDIPEDLVPDSLKETYEVVCPPDDDDDDDSNVCKSVNIISSTEVPSNSANIEYDGNIKFYPKSVALNNLFANGASKGFNWRGFTSGYENITNFGDTPSGVSIASIISEIEAKGESIYGLEPDFEIVITPACASEIRKFNREQETNSLGFNDYTLNAANYHLSDTSAFIANLEGAGCRIVKNLD